MPIFQWDHFSQKHALALRPQGAIYSFIPKNACSTLRYSVAVANGRSIDGTPPPTANRAVAGLRATRREISDARYAFVVLRCPYRRAASAFLDKVVREKSRARSVLASDPMHGLMKTLRLIEDRTINASILSLTFQGFLKVLQERKFHLLDHHFRPQCDFLLSRGYDDFFSVEAMAMATESLRMKIGFTVIDSSRYLHHHIAKMERIDVEAATMPVAELLELKRNGTAPTYGSLYSETTKKLVQEIYSCDIALYTGKFGREDLLFSK